MKVVTSHPGKQVVVYSIVSQLLAYNSLAAHLASVYYDPSKLRYSVWSHLPGTVGDRIDRQLQKRRSPALPANMVIDGPWAEMVMAALARVPLVANMFSGGQLYRCTNWFHDRRAARWVSHQSHIDAVIAFQGAALKTLVAARSINARAVLVATHPVDHEDIVATEYARYGRRYAATTRNRVLQEAAAADYILTASSYTTEALERRGVQASRIKEIPYGIDCDCAQPPQRRPVDRRPVRFLFVGKLSLHKGLHILRDAFQSLAMSDVALTIIGRPVGPIERRLLSTWHDSRLQVVSEVCDITAEYEAADVFVLPSLVEGFGMVTLEAMATGLPVIVTDRCSTFVRNGVDGYVVASGSAEELRGRMMHLARCPAERIRLGNNARERAAEFSWARFGKEFHDWLLEITR
jgi:glycosyltransferase involved in cell wall biosynthesis